MSRRRLLVPGTGGVLYKRANGRRAATILDLATKPGARKLLRCEHHERPSVLKPIATSGKEGEDLLPTGHMTLAYEPFDHAVPGWDAFDYDWRLDMRYNGGKLASRLLREAGAGDRWRIVGHSQGGLVILWAARVLGADRFAELVHSVVFVGVPFFGTVNAVDGLLHGSLPGGIVPATLVRTWPAIYQMLPRWDATVSGSSTPPLLLNKTWKRAGLLPGDLSDVQISRHVDPHLLARARAWHRINQTHQFEALRKLKYVRIIHGINYPTRERVPDFPDLGTNVVEERGDTLVPSDLTVDSLPSWVRDEASIKRFPAAEHMLLCSDRNVYEWCP